ncbi:MAG TPA: hypothetical protein VFR15_02380 [Chloroflexia bacterium]|nr:hypothetical protein [Chloroflexia bacterium]
MNQSPVQHALLVLVMVALMLAGGLIESGRAAAPTGASEANVAAPVAVYAAAVTACSHAR